MYIIGHHLSFHFHYKKFLYVWLNKIWEQNFFHICCKCVVLLHYGFVNELLDWIYLKSFSDKLGNCRASLLCGFSCVLLAAMVLKMFYHKYYNCDLQCGFSYAWKMLALIRRSKENIYQLIINLLLCYLVTKVTLSGLAVVRRSVSLPVSC